MSATNKILIGVVVVALLAALAWFGHFQDRDDSGVSLRALQPGEILFSAQGSIAGRRVVRHIDWRCQFFFYDSTERYAATAQQAVQLLREVAQKAGANGVLGVGFVHVGSQVRGPAGPVSQVALCGDLVELR